MSKTIDSLKILPTAKDILNEHIADTYFSKKPRRRRQSKIAVKKTNILTILGICSGACLLAFIVLALGSFFHGHYTDYLKKKFELSGTVAVVSAGFVNKDIVERFEFRGRATTTSKVENKIVVLNNPKKYEWADLSFVFKFPLNLSDRTLSLSLKGKKGGEKISVVLRDIEKRIWVIDDIFLTSSWRTEAIPLDTKNTNIDLAKIDALRVESGFVGEAPQDPDRIPAEMSIYIKDIVLSKRR